MEERVPQRTAACACGQFRITLTDEPDQIGMCSCAERQRRTGSVFGVGAFLAGSKVQAIEEKCPRSARRADSGNTITFDFCPTCGTTLHWENSARQGFIAVAVGAFDDPNFPPPRI